MDEHQHLPDVNQISVVTAAIMLAYALMPFVHIPDMALVLRLPFGIFSFGIEVSTIVSLLTALLAAIGTDWLLRGHPHLEGRATLPHLILPALTAWSLGVPLNSLTVGAQWWAVFALGGVLLVAVLIGEYVVVDFQDARHGLASIGLTALSFALFLTLAVAVRAAGLRLYMLLPLLALTLGLIGLRTTYLRSGGEWGLAWSFVIVAVISQMAMGFQYWPLSPLAYGLALTGPAYAMTSVAGAMVEGRSELSILTEPGIVMLLLWLLALIVGG